MFEYFISERLNSSLRLRSSSACYNTPVFHKDVLTWVTLVTRANMVTIIESVMVLCNQITADSCMAT